MKFIGTPFFAILISLPTSVVAASPGEPARAPARSIKSHYLDAPLGFETNRGQADPTVAFISQGEGYTLLLSRNEAILRIIHRKPARGEGQVDTIRTAFLGSNAQTGIAGMARISGVSNYLIGADSSHWLRNIPHFARVEYQSIYPGIKLTYYGNQSHLEYDFEISPHANAKSIGFAIAGAHPRIASNGDLILITPGGETAWRKPAAYQMISGEKREIACSYAVAGNHVRFKLGAYDPDHTLTIDPPLVWGSFLGGTSYDSLTGGMQVDAAGEVVVAGSTHSLDFPTTAGAYDGTFHASSDPYAVLDVFVSKFSADGKSLVYSTYVGGSDVDYAYGLAVDAAGNAYVSGTTLSKDFPYTSGSYRSPLTSSGFNNYLFKLDPSGANLVYSLSALASGGVAVDSSGSAYNAGRWPLGSVPYPFTPGAYHNQLIPGKTYVSVAKYHPDGSALDYAALIGSVGTTSAKAITVDGLGEATITGVSYTRGYSGEPYPVTPGEPTGIGDDALVTKFNAAGTDLVYSALLPGADPGGVSSDQVGNVAVGGYASTELPTTPNAYQQSFPSSGTGIHQAFVTRFDPTGHITYSTYLGGNLPPNTVEFAFSTALEPGGIMDVVGDKHSTTFPITDPTYLTDSCGWLARIDPSASGTASLVYSGCLSANPVQYVAVLRDGEVYLAGQNTGPTVLDAAQPFSNFGDDGQAFAEVWVGSLNFADPPPPQPVIVNSPPNGQITGLPLHYVASATTSCDQGVAAIGVYTAPDVLQYWQPGAQLDTTFSLPSGKYNTIVQSWDNCGGAAKTPISIEILPGGVVVSSPQDGATVTSPVHFVAQATSPTCRNGISAMRIYSAPGVDVYDAFMHIDTFINLSPGQYQVVMQAWDNCGNVFKTPLNITVQ